MKQNKKWHGSLTLGCAGVVAGNGAEKQISLNNLHVNIVYSVEYRFSLQPKLCVFVWLGNVVGKLLQGREVEIDRKYRVMYLLPCLCNSYFRLLQEPCLMKWQNG